LANRPHKTKLFRHPLHTTVIGKLQIKAAYKSKQPLFFTVKILLNPLASPTFAAPLKAKGAYAKQTGVL